MKRSSYCLLFKNYLIILYHVFDHFYSILNFTWLIFDKNFFE
jgi:hypothetical protein